MNRTCVRRVVGRFVAAVVVGLAFVPMLAAPGAQAQGLPQFKVVKLVFDGILDEKGNLAVTASWKFPTNAEYLNAKKMYPSPNVLFREIFTGRSAFLVENAKASYNDAANSVAMSARFTGAAALRVRQWELDTGKGLELAWQDAERLVLVQVVPLEPYYLMAKYKIVLPNKATGAKYSAESGLITYTLPVAAARGDALLDVELKCKPRVMSAAYKVYGNSDVGAGAFWVAKTAFRNVGKGNIRDLQVSYKLGEYSDWSEPRSYAVIVPGGTVVDLALLYASTCEAVGLGAYILVIPGHAYPIIKLPSGSVLPVETTGVGGAAIGKASSFEEAVKIAQKNLPKDTSEKPHYLVDLEEMWSLGVTNPELPKLDADVLQKWGYGLQAVARAAGAAPAPAPAPHPPPPRASRVRIAA